LQRVPLDDADVAAEGFGGGEYGQHGSDTITGLKIGHCERFLVNNN
jgi:hypothetical protein